ncbi:MAG TPA: NADH-quinone oxidoreductase subunit C, partial [Dehalococcoidia bacterium]|nr:NADH-quinone oxidoreductase subunit C [Dehalococcoidia bacterium]
MLAATRSLLDDSPVPLQMQPTSAANEILVSCERADLPTVISHFLSRGAQLSTMVGLDLTRANGEYAVEYVLSAPGDEFVRVRAAVPGQDREYPSVTLVAPAAHWYEREAKDLLGLTPIDHPDPRRLVLHEGYPHGYHPLLKDVSATEKAVVDARRFDYFEVHGEGVYELPVGPIHAGIIEPGHFRFSNIGELILHLDARLFFTHRGVEKVVERKSFDEALFTVERTCGVCTVSHGVSFASAVERLARSEVPPRAVWIRTLLLELERIYNHVGDIGNICAGTGFHFGSSRGAILKEGLQRLNEELTGHRFLMGVVGVGGLRYDLAAGALNHTHSLLPELRDDFEAYLSAILGTDSFVTRINGPGKLDAATVLALGGTGITARASGLETDYRINHPHLAYPALQPALVVESEGDVAARLKVRAREALESFDLAQRLIEGMPGGAICTPIGDVPVGASALGYSESPRGSNVHWLMAGPNATVDRLR